MLSPDEIRRLELERIKAYEARQKRLMIRLFVGGGAVLFIAFIIWAIAGFPTTKSQPSCMDRGREYYKEIGAYPKLSDGRDAEDVIYGMCSNARDSDTLFQHNDK